jgi:hypothetical protein
LFLGELTSRDGFLLLGTFRFRFSVYKVVSLYIGGLITGCEIPEKERVVHVGVGTFKFVHMLFVR